MNMDVLHIWLHERNRIPLREMTGKKGIKKMKGLSGN